MFVSEYAYFMAWVWSEDKPLLTFTWTPGSKHGS